MYIRIVFDSCFVAGGVVVVDGFVGRGIFSVRSRLIGPAVGEILAFDLHLESVVYGGLVLDG